MKHIVSALFGVALLLAVTPAHAVPTTVAFTGRLTTSSGPVNGTVASIKFTLFDQLTNGNVKWTETRSNITADQGLVYADLGSLTTLDETILTNNPLFLEIQVGTEVLTPRLPLQSVPYAIRAEVANSADLLGTIAPGDVVTGVTSGGGVNATKTGNNVTLSVDTSVIQSRVTGTCASGSSIASINANGTVNCQTSVTTEGDAIIGNEVTGNADTTLVRSGAGTALSPYSLAVDTNVIQKRVTGTCGTGSSIRSIDANGGVICQTDSTGITSEADGVVGNEILGPTTGSGLVRSGAGTGASPFTLGVDTSVIQARVVGSCSAGQAIRAIDAAGNVTCDASNDDTVGNEVVGASDATLTLFGTGTKADPLKLAVNDTVMQRRVGNVCPNGSSIRAIAADGSITCQNDTAGAIVTVIGGGTVAAGNFNTATVLCPATNPHVLGGGVDNNNVLKMVVTASGPSIGVSGRPLGNADGNYGAGNGWWGAVVNNDTTTQIFKVVAICGQ